MDLGVGVVAGLMVCIFISPVWLLVCLFGIAKIEKTLDGIKHILEAIKEEKK